ncbi:MAG TPA: alanyl-tRNA editing protein [Oribacterium sp.]|nr:alanyl-tRNA editing protein [Oribacterium sp.]
MEKRALYYASSYVKEFDAEVTSCTALPDAAEPRYLVELSRHGFYPEGGGQDADHGSIGDAQVLDVQEVPVLDPATGEKQRDAVGNVIVRVLHTVDRALPVGAELHCVIDWARRMRNTRNHSGEHIVSGLVHRHYGYNNVGFHMSEVMTIDFDGPLSWEQLMDIEAEANAIVLEDRPVTALWPTPEELEAMDYRSKKPLSGDVRIVDLGGADLCACCGTHVQRTGEIGPIKILSMISHKGGVRLELFCGLDALSDADRKHAQVVDLSRLLNVAPSEVVEAVKSFMADSLQKDRRIAELNTRYYELKAEKLREMEGVLVDFEEGMNAVELRKCCDYFMKHTKASVVGVFCPKENGTTGENETRTCSYVIGSTALDVRERAKAFNARVQGRGGGQKEMIQGSLSGTAAEIQQAMQEIFSN